MSKVILYTTHCPKCRILQKKLESKKINFEIVENVDIMSEKGFKSAPMLEVDGNVLEYYSAIKFVNEHSTEETI